MAQNLNIDKRLQGFETTLLGRCRNINEQLGTPHDTSQATSDIEAGSLGSEQVPESSLAALARELHGSRSSQSHVTMLVEYLEEGWEDLRTSNYSLELKKDWVRFASKELLLGGHVQSCKTGQDQGWRSFMFQRSNQLSFEHTSRLLYRPTESPQQFDHGICNFEEIVNRGEAYITELQECKKSWENEGMSLRDSNFTHFNRAYLRTCSMAILPYLKAASTWSILPLPAERASLNANQRRLMDLVIQCVSFAFQSARIPSVLKPLLIHTCKGCQNDRAHAIHE